MQTPEEILAQEYSTQFDEKRKHAMLTSYYKYGAVKINYPAKNIDAIEELIDRLESFKKTGNTEYLIDIANFAMIRFMYPQNNEHYTPKDTENSLVSGMGIAEINRFQEDK